MFLAAKEFPLPVEYRFLPLEEVFHEPPADIADRTVVFLDCGNIDRMPVDFLQRRRDDVINIDHHHDNTRFGDVNLVDVERLLHRGDRLRAGACCSGVELTPEIAAALYVGLVTDTGRFMYENTDARSHRMAAALIEAGVDVDDIYRRLYEHVPLEKLRLVARALEKIERDCDGRLVGHLHHRRRTTRRPAPSEEMTEGIIDHLRSIEGAQVAAVVRDLGDRGRAARKVSLRSADGEVDVSAIAREHGGGGHTRAAGFSTDLDVSSEVVEFLCGEIAAQLALSWRWEPAAAVLLSTSRPASPRTTSSPQVRRERGVQGRPRRHARPVRDRAAARPARPGDAPAALPARRCRRPIGRPRGSAGARAPATPTAS